MRLDGPKTKPPKGTKWSFAFSCGNGVNPHESCPGCGCGCHSLDPWPFETCETDD